MPSRDARVTDQCIRLFDFSESSLRKRANCRPQVANIPTGHPRELYMMAQLCLLRPYPPGGRIVGMRTKDDDPKRVTVGLKYKLPVPGPRGLTTSPIRAFALILGA
jgi:hypothetical protein